MEVGRLQVRDDGVGHGAGADGFLAEGDVGGARAGSDGAADGGFDAFGGFLEAEAMAQHEGARENLCAGIGDALAGDVGRGAAGGLV